MDLTILAAALAVIAGPLAGVGIGLATGKACESIARQPEASGKVMSAMILGAALAEATAIYTFVVALIILFVK